MVRIAGANHGPADLQIFGGFQNRARAAFQAEGFERQGPMAFAALGPFKRNAPGDAILGLLIGEGVADRHGVLAEGRQRILPNAVFEHGAENQIAGLSQGAFQTLVLGGIAAIGQHQVDRHQLRPGCGGDPLQRVCEDGADVADASHGGQRGVVDGEDDGAGRRGRGRVAAEHPVVGVVVHLRGDRGIAGHHGHRQASRQDGGVPGGRVT